MACTGSRWVNGRRPPQSAVCWQVVPGGVIVAQQPLMTPAINRKRAYPPGDEPAAVCWQGACKGGGGRDDRGTLLAHDGHLTRGAKGTMRYGEGP